MHKSYRILSVEAADIYKAERENGAAVGVQLPERNSDACFRLFKVFLGQRGAGNDIHARLPQAIFLCG